MNTITIIGISIILLYSITQILNFYGITQERYGIYIMFYIFILGCIVILPHDYPK
jgi:hypothetical protein